MNRIRRGVRPRGNEAYQSLRLQIFLYATLLSFVSAAFCQPKEEAQSRVQDSDELARWNVGAPLFLPGPPGQFDETAVKDPSIVYFKGRWNLFYTARGRGEYSVGYVSSDRLDGLNSAPRQYLKQVYSNRSSYAAAPQVFFFAPQEKWYLIYQTQDSNYQPAYSTTLTIEDPESWSAPRRLVEKEDSKKWIDFWVLCHEQTAYLFFTRDHQDVYVMATGLQEFPEGFRDPRLVFSPVHEAVHVYRVRNALEFHMLYETRTDEGLRRYGLAESNHPLGPWRRISDDYIGPDRLNRPDEGRGWTEMVSHGEMIRSGSDQGLEYDPTTADFLIQGLTKNEMEGDYSEFPWKLGLLTRTE